MDKSNDNTINYFSFYPKNSNDFHQNDKNKYNLYINNPLFEYNFPKYYDLNYGDRSSNLNYSILGTEDNFNQNKKTADSDISEAFSETSKQDLTICDFISFPKSIDQGSTHDNILISDFKHKKKIFSVRQFKVNTSTINNLKNDVKIKNIFRVEYPNSFNIFHPGSYEKYPRDLINLILENKTNIPLSKRNKIKKKRKFYSDNIRRKIKCTFHNSLKNTLNKRLKYTNSKFFFEYLPQSFITNVTKEGNKKILNMTFEQLFLKDFNETKAKVTKNNLEKRRANKLVIEGIEQNEKVKEKSNYNNYKYMKYYEIYEEYLRSKEFEEDIIKLEKTQSKEYIKQYINLALHLIDYFSSA